MPGLGPHAFGALLEHFGSPAACLAASEGALRAVLGNAALAGRVHTARKLEAIRAELAWLEAAPEHFLLARGAEGYPELLAQLPDPPPVVLGMGDPGALGAAQLAIVGSRSATPAGCDHAHAFAAALAQAGYVITSGLALGIDAAAHRGALEAGGRTVAVLGSGPDRIYPAEHRSLARRIMAAGAVISELPPGTGPRPGHFPRRNRIIAGLARGTLVVEAGVRSGALITARLAAEQGREVFALPGPINSPVARGCHALLKEGAALVEQVDDILTQLGGWQAPPPGSGRHPETAGRDASPPAATDAGTARLLASLGAEPASVDTLVARSGLTAPSVSSMLLLLELEGVVAALPGGQYVRRPARGNQ